MQLENPLIPILHSVLHDFLRKLFCHFLDIRRVKEVGAELIDPYDLAQRTDQQLGIGFATKNKVGILVHSMLKHLPMLEATCRSMTMCLRMPGFQTLKRGSQLT